MLLRSLMFIKSCVRVLTIVISLTGSLPAQSKTDLQKGKQLFDARCSNCHGFDGTGGAGPNLNRPVLTRAPDDAALSEIIRMGIPAGGMPAVLRYASENE